MALKISAKRAQQKSSVKRKYRKQQEKNNSGKQENYNKINNFSPETMKARREWSNMDKELKKNAVNKKSCVLQTSLLKMKAK